MTTELMWLGHGSWKIETAGKTVLLDPYLDENPASPVKAADVHADFILVSHGHFDHHLDVPGIARRCGSLVVANYEIAEWFRTKHNLPNTLGMNLGGGVELPFGHVRMTIAFHSSTLPDASPGGSPCGFLLTLKDRKKVYFACDTALFDEMKRIGTAGIDLAVLPIGDLFTMGPEDACRATQLLKPAFVTPDHYNTWPPITQDAQEWARTVRNCTTSDPIVIPPGGKISL
jgi:L-ascorbate metabolism protein UlaG (beta-lactamase superfamily)